MKVFFHPDFYTVYAYDPAAAMGRMEAIVEEIKEIITFAEPLPATEEDIATCHGSRHIDTVKKEGVYDIAALAAGGAIAAAETGLTEPAFGLIRPPGHHASRDSAWGSATSTTWPSPWKNCAERVGLKVPWSSILICTLVTAP